MKVTDSWNVAGMTILTLSDGLPEHTWRSIVIDGQAFEPRIPMYGGDTSRLKNNMVSVRGEHDFTGKDVEFV